MLLNCIQFAVLISQQSHIHIGADIQAALLEGPQNSSLWAPCWRCPIACRRRLVRFKHPAGTYLPADRLLPPPLSVSPTFALFYPIFSFLLTPKTIFLTNSLHYICGFSWGRVENNANYETCICARVGLITITQVHAQKESTLEVCCREH
jgi:hypothetical protein